MFEFKWTIEAIEVYTDLEQRAELAFSNRRERKENKSTKIEGLFKQVYKALNLLKSDPRHPGLNTHEYDSIKHPYNLKDKVFEAYAQNKTPGAYRIFWCYGPGHKEITIISITPHP